MAIKATPTPDSQLVSPKDHTLIPIDFQLQASRLRESDDESVGALRLRQPDRRLLYQF